MPRAWKMLGIVVFGVLLAFSAVAAYDAFSAHGVSRLKGEVADLKDTVRKRDANADLADEQARRQHAAIIRLNAVIDRKSDSLRKVTAFADSVRTAARSARQTTNVVRGVDVDTLFLAGTPYVVAPPVTAHIDVLEGVIVADSLELAQLRPYVGLVEQLRDSLFSLDSTRVVQVTERDASIATRESIIAKQDTIIAKQNPHCGKKCGMAIGSGVTAVLVWLGAQLVRAVGGGQ